MADLKKDAETIEIAIDVLSLGTKVVKFTMPLDFVEKINQIYDKNLKRLKPHNDYLAGKIAEENRVDEILTSEMNKIFKFCFEQYLIENQTASGKYNLHLSAAWINEMKAGEYNPTHYHTSESSEVGLSSVLMLKRPDWYGVEASLEEKPSNGWLEFTGGDQSPLSRSQIRVDAQVGELYVFPYTLLHCVYPFNSNDQVRRTMSYNCNLKLKEL